ncbi:MAG: aminotransferase class I/II-fold pyridoxal phosphate-dependent enzyme [Candidatus Hodgkinia cicadicola]
MDDGYINEENIDCFNRSNQCYLIKTFSKNHGLVSLRIGWIYAHKNI